MKISADKLFWKSCKHGGSRKGSFLSYDFLNKLFFMLLHDA